MTQRRNPYRLSVLAGICLLFLLLAVMVTNLVTQVQGLSRAAGDNTQWSITQIDTEFANLDALLTEQVSGGTFDADQVRLRVDIALSRLNIINAGRAADIFGDSQLATQLIAEINTFATRAIATLDAPEPLDAQALTQLQQAVRAVRPAVRDIALLGIQLGAERSEARRGQFANQLIWTGGTAIALLLLMSGLMVALDRLLLRAARRDAELSASSKQLSSTVAASLDAIVTADVDGRIIGFNTAAERVFGWRRDDIIGLTMEDTFIPHRMRDAHHNGMQRYLKTGQPRVVGAGRVELAALRKSGEEFPVELNITTAQDGPDTIFIAYIRDISERKINEQKMIDARDRAQRTDKAKSQFLTVMSHEMRTPLNGILGVLDLLKTTQLNDQQMRYANIATSSSEVLLGHVNEALDITRIETGNLQLSTQDFRLTELMQGLIDMFEPLAREKGLWVALDIDAAMRGPYRGDAGRIRQILTNLIGNAIKFTQKGGVTVAVSGVHGPNTSALRFAVSDTGIGIDPEQHENVFEDFFADASADERQARGDGLGLAISRRIARALDGDVTLMSAKGEGATFVLALPLTRGDSTDPAEAKAQEDAAHSHKSSTVLIVEDNTINRSILSDMLQSMGHSVQSAVNGFEAVERAKETKFDVIFMDISMPVMDGIEATQQIREQSQSNAQTLIVGLTAHGREEYRDRAIAAGMDRFHTKPIRLDALTSVLSEVTGAPMSKLDGEHYPEALTEMIDLLGRAKVQSIAAVFFAELADLGALLQAQRTAEDRDVLAEAAHKAKGAASVLGQGALQETLFEIETLARDNSLNDQSSWLHRLQRETQAAQTLLQDL